MGEILWAVDPFAKDIKLQQSAARILRALVSRKKGACIEPIYVIDPFLAAYSNKVKDLASLHETADKRIRKLLGGPRKKNLQPIKVITDPNLSQRHAVDKILEYGSDVGASLLVTASHARRGPRRWVLGSFAETLMLRGSIPTLIVNPRWNGNPRFRSILFPTDFSSESHRAFQECLRWAKEWGAKVSIFHRPVPFVLPIPTLTPEFVWLGDDFRGRALEGALEDARRKMTKLVDAAKKSAVPVTTSIDSTSLGSVAGSIIKQAKAIKAGIIVMSPHSGGLTAAWLGSVAREVVRESPMPVLIVHSSKKGGSKDLGKAPKSFVTQDRPFAAV